jgi:hypothetical protein
MRDLDLDFLEAVKRSTISEKTRNLLINRITTWSILLDLTHAQIEGLAEYDANSMKEIEEFQFSNMIRCSQLSNRAKNVLLSNVSTVFDLIRFRHEHIAGFWSCGRLTLAEILQYQQLAVNKFGGVTEGHKPDKTSDLPGMAPQAIDDRDSWVNLVLNSCLSARTTVILTTNIHNLAHFFRMDENELRDLRNCCGKTLNEMLAFRKELQDRFGPAPQNVELKAAEKSAIDLNELDRQYYLLRNMGEILSVRARNALEQLKADTLEKFLRLAPNSMRKARNVGQKTIRELNTFREVVCELIAGIPNGDISCFDIVAFYSALRRAQAKLTGVKSVNTAQFDFDNPNDSLTEWITDSCHLMSNTERVKTVFLMRYGMHGEPVPTLEEIGARFNITRERVRQIVAKVEREGQGSVGVGPSWMLD